jgi:hypothetical protein
MEACTAVGSQALSHGILAALPEQTCGAPFSSACSVIVC